MDIELSDFIAGALAGIRRLHTDSGGTDQGIAQLWCGVAKKVV
jgi:hypothetical protein